MSRALVVLLAVLLTGRAEAQGLRPLVKYGKWVLAAGAVTMNVLAARDHDRGDEVFDELEHRCLANHSLCDLDTSGHYVNAESEDLYQASLRYDRRARGWLIGGETALLGAAAMLIWELTGKTHRPDNIPFEPEVKSLNRATGVGVRMRW
ncbi:MAG TPA: hypothetical protein VH763_10175 [Gemmatimonadales bacterium]|jgi:hypothetical protein